jgi:hypothetical protein
MKTLKLCSLLAALLVSPLFGAGNWHTDFDAAKKLAAKEGKDLLIDFTGSDWCVRLEKEAPKPAPPAPPRKAESCPAKTKGVARMSDAQLKKALGEARRDLVKIKSTHDDSKQGWEKVQSSLKDLRTRLQAKERELATLRKALAGEEKKAGTLKKQHDSVHAAESSAKSALEALEKDLKRRDMITKLEAEAAVLQRKAEELREQAEKLRH